MASLPRVRAVVLGAVLLLALVELGLSCALLQATAGLETVSLTHTILALAAAAFTILVVVPLLVLAGVRPGGPASSLAAELPLLGLCAVLWLAAGGATAHALGDTDLWAYGYTPYCARAFVAVARGAFPAICAQTRALAAFAFVIGVLLVGYLAMRVALAVRRKQPVWTTSVGGRADRAKAQGGGPGPALAQA
ncbi:hypothetical protein MIND_01428300 [Mycena indigotica]|uniref:MARVEL domain-containing protein n=1 Tax=Mycena indigotica TaxID=2126181 RepID=A0A8H6VNT8_9AGAR|nr:uncharacterized protein MIND_01428300 [Mycena indigotica]KAF7288617.1 hypothetical protein MIND_01428300 [Mycena indigotica]